MTVSSNNAVLRTSFVKNLRADQNVEKDGIVRVRARQGADGIRQESRKTFISRQSLPSGDGEGQDWLWLAVVYGILRSVRGRETR